MLATLLLSLASPALPKTRGPVSRAEQFALVRKLTDIGRQAFSDPGLSAAGAISCASCHSPQNHFGPPNALAVQYGGVDMRQPGLRAVPSLTYVEASPPFTEHYFDSEDEADESVDNGPTGGLTWDGRADRGRAQARIPLFSPIEMANPDAARIAAHLRTAPYAAALRDALGADVLDDPAHAVDAIAQALEVYEQDAATFYSYSSKYDAYLAGSITLTPQEARGLALFNDPKKGNCAQCHLSERANDGTPPQFTDFGFIALAVPRNATIPANADPSYYDLGLCGPLRTDFRARTDYCGLFRTPSLRNVATRHTFFHNGVYHDLRDVLRFYAGRDVTPEKFYPRRPDGTVAIYDDLPLRYQANVNTDPPFGKRDTPALTESEIDDIITFLGTLTDGYQPPIRQLRQPLARNSQAGQTPQP